MALLCILLVTYSSRGHQLVFSYPHLTSADGKLLGFDPSFLADILSPKANLCDRKFHLRVHGVDFIGHPTLLKAEQQQDTALDVDLGADDETSSSMATPSQLTMFHVVFALANCDQEELDLVYDHCLLKITNTLKEEQLRRDYVRSDREIILNIKETYLRGDADFTNLDEEILKRSSLATTIKKLFLMMKGTRPDPRLTLSSHIRHPLSIQTDLEKLRLVGKPLVHGAAKTLFPSLRPYHAILLLFEAETVIQNLLPSPNSLLVKFVRAALPTKSFEQLELMLECTLAQIYKMAADLHYWGQGMIIHKISPRNFYVLTDDPVTAFINLPTLAIEFSSKFAPLSIVSMLSDISLPRPLNAIIPTKELKPIYLDAMAFLLRHDMLINLHMYLLLRIPQHVVEKACERPRMHDALHVLPAKEDRRSFVVADPANLTEFEQECVELLKEARTSKVEVQKFFMRIVKYLTGKCHIDEILFEEHMSKKELKMVMSAYRDEIIPTLHGQGDK